MKARRTRVLHPRVPSAPTALRHLGAILAIATLTSCSWSGAADAELCAALAQNHLTRVFSTSASLSCSDMKTDSPPAALLSALRGRDAGALRLALATTKGSALLVESAATKAGSVAGELGRFAALPGVRGLALSKDRALYAASREPELSPRERDGLAYVARALLRGAREPSLNAFPPAHRRVERVEVMVLLRERGSARLWRSARGTSLARALLTATRVARDRWHERETAMGGPLSERLLDLDVEVSLLAEDGVLIDPQQKLVDQALTPEHGIGFEYRSGWHYLLPEDVKRRGQGSAYRALLSLMSEQGIPASSLSSGAGLRVYRFVTVTLGTSTAPLGAGSSPG